MFILKHSCLQLHIGATQPVANRALPDIVQEKTHYKPAEQSRYELSASRIHIASVLTTAATEEQTDLSICLLDRFTHHAVHLTPRTELEGAASNWNGKACTGFRNDIVRKVQALCNSCVQ